MVAQNSRPVFPKIAEGANKGFKTQDVFTLNIY